MKRGDVIWVRIPRKGGREQAGARPAILVQQDEGPKLSPTLVIVPLTSQLQAERFGYTLRIAPSEQNGLRVESVAMVFQIAATDRLSVEKQLGTLTNDDYDRICETIGSLVQKPLVTVGECE